jgi:hypothetical protein
LDYQITVPVENVQGTGFSRASEAALMIAIRIIQEETGHHVDSLEVKANKVQTNAMLSSTTTNQLRFSPEVFDVHQEAVVSTSFALTLSMSIYMEDKDSAKNVYADSTTALTTAAKNGMLHTLFRNFAIQFNAVESTQGSVGAMSYSKYSYNAPASTSTPQKDAFVPPNMLAIVIPIALGLTLLVCLIYFLLRYLQAQTDAKQSRSDRYSNNFSNSEEYLAKRISNDYSIPNQEQGSIDFLADTFINRHGCSEYDAECSPKEQRSSLSGSAVDNQREKNEASAPFEFSAV